MTPLKTLYTLIYFFFFVGIFTMKALGKDAVVSHSDRDIKLRIWSVIMDEEDHYAIDHKKTGPWIAYTESAILFKLSDGREYGHGVPFLMICRVGSTRKLMIASEALFGAADFRVRELTNTKIVFDVIDTDTDTVVKTIDYELEFPADLRAPFIDGVWVEVLGLEPGSI